MKLAENLGVGLVIERAEQLSDVRLGNWVYQASRSGTCMSGPRDLNSQIIASGQGKKFRKQQIHATESKLVDLLVV